MPAPARARALAALSERAWQDLVIQYARLHGWWVYHPHDSRRSEPGWPDLVLVRPPDAIFAELKTSTGRITAVQRQVLDQLHHCGLEIHVWRPADEREVFSRLARPSPEREAPVCDPTVQQPSS